jgi:hypothetical protein
MAGKSMARSTGAVHNALSRWAMPVSMIKLVKHKEETANA